MAVRWPYGRERYGHRTQANAQRAPRSRTTPEDRALIDQAVAVSGTDLTEFVITNLTTASRRVLADRTEFRMGAEAQQAWEEVNRRPARSLAGLRELLARPSPFIDE